MFLILNRFIEVIVKMSLISSKLAKALYVVSKIMPIFVAE